MSQYWRLLPLLIRTQPQTSLFKEPPSQALSSASVSFRRIHDHCRRILQTQPSGQANEDTENHEADSLKSTSQLANVPSETNHSAVTHTSISKEPPSQALSFASECFRIMHEADSLKSASQLASVPSETNHSAVKYAAVCVTAHACGVCGKILVRAFFRESYEKGVVVTRCGECNNLHLIADRLGWFGEPGSIEDFLAARGEGLRKGLAETLNLTLEDLDGKGARDVSFRYFRLKGILD